MFLTMCQVFADRPNICVPGDAMARLEGVLARAPGPALDKAHATAPGGEFEPHTPEEEPDAELTG